MPPSPSREETADGWMNGTSKGSFALLKQVCLGKHGHQATPAGEARGRTEEVAFAFRIYICICRFAWTSPCVPFMCTACGGQESAARTEPGSQQVVSHHVGARELNPGPLLGTAGALNLSHLSSPSGAILEEISPRLGRNFKGKGDMVEYK